MLSTLHIQDNRLGAARGLKFGPQPHRVWNLVTEVGYTHEESNQYKAICDKGFFKKKKDLCKQLDIEAGRARNQQGLEYLEGSFK